MEGGLQPAWDFSPAPCAHFSGHSSGAEAPRGLKPALLERAHYAQRTVDLRDAVVNVRAVAHAGSARGARAQTALPHLVLQLRASHAVYAVHRDGGTHRFVVRGIDFD